ncbi:monooxygenase [Ornithinimicrobium cerasi]|uniref:monooxygenase n=1 Tax=Ornithinimicrobium cerasi TaxID=2248773 RepID=UPI000F00E800|nr:monooxygenase [Ornithinimicrobium cerasi]
MSTLLYFEFPSEGPFGQESAAAYAALAQDISVEDGLIWKVWTEHPETSTAGGVYLFEDAGSAARYVEKHTERLAGFGITDIVAKEFTVNEELSATTRAVLRR